MSYRMPARALGATEPVDPRKVNENTQPLAQDVSGRGNEHNLKAGVLTASQVFPQTYYIPHYTDTAANAGFSTNNGICDGTTDANSIRVGDSGEWMTVLSLTFDTGEDKLWTIGWATWGTSPLDAYDEYATNTRNKPRLQFAIRVDGTLYEDVLTGMVELNFAAPQGLKIETPLDPDRDDTWGPTVSIHTPVTPGCQSLMQHVHPMRTELWSAHPAGTRTVELVVRRIPPDGAYDAVSYTGTDPDPVYVFNAKLFSLQVTENAGATGASAGLEIDSVDDGDEIDAATLSTNNQAKAAATLNALKPGHYTRHALRAEHLPSLILYPCQVGQTTGNTTTTPYTYSATPTRQPDGINWDYVNDGLGTNLKTTNGPFDFTTYPAFVLILANVFVSQIGDTGDTAGRQDGIAVFGIGGTYSGGAGYFANASGEGYLNTNTTWESAQGYEPVLTDVPLMECFDFRTVPPPHAIDSFQVVASRYGRGGTAGTQPVTWDRSNLLMLVFRY